MAAIARMAIAARPGDGCASQGSGTDHVDAVRAWEMPAGRFRHRRIVWRMGGR